MLCEYVQRIECKKQESYEENIQWYMLSSDIYPHYQWYYCCENDAKIGICVRDPFYCK